jgi:beta-glucanase (GH16 family)
MILMVGGKAQAQPCAGGKYTVCQSFDKLWLSGHSSDGLWRINGPWPGTGNMLDPALALVAPDGSGGGSVMLSVAEKRGSEIQSLMSYGYGYYETELKVSSVPGVCASFFWIEAPKYGPHEWDIEFLTDDFAGAQGAVRLTIHPSNLSYKLDLPFNPSDAFHRYGFLWTPGQIIFTVDGKAAHTVSNTELETTARGFIMMNALTGLPNWCNGPPAVQTTSIYNWMRFTEGTSKVPVR